jgi:hypothetical protein
VLSAAEILEFPGLRAHPGSLGFRATPELRVTREFQGYLGSQATQVFPAFQVFLAFQVLRAIREFLIPVFEQSRNWQ